MTPVFDVTNPGAGQNPFGHVPHGHLPQGQIPLDTYLHVWQGLYLSLLNLNLMIW